MGLLTRTCVLVLLITLCGTTVQASHSISQREPAPGDYKELPTSKVIELATAKTDFKDLWFSLSSRLVAIRELGNRDSPEAKRTLIDIYHKGDETCKLYAAVGLVKREKDLVRPYLVKRVEAGVDLSALMAAEALATVGDVTGSGLSLALLTDPRVIYSMGAANVIERINDPKLTKDAIEKLTLTGDKQHALLALRLYKKLPPSKDTMAIEKLLNHDDGFVRSTAIATIAANATWKNADILLAELKGDGSLDDSLIHYNLVKITGINYGEEKLKYPSPSHNLKAFWQNWIRTHRQDHSADDVIVKQAPETTN